MSDGFTPEFFTDNRQRLRALAGEGILIVLTAQGRLQRQADAAYVFYQDPSFWYCTGIDEPDVVLVLDGEREYLIVPARDEIHTVFDGALDVSALQQRAGVATAYETDDGWERLNKRLARQQKVGTMAAAPSFLAHYAMYTNPARRQLARKLKRANPALELVDISTHMARLRMVKQSPEITALQQAADTTIQGLQQIFANLRKGMYATEYEIEADLTRAFRLAGARGHAFDPIVAGGRQACTLHNISNATPLQVGELLLFDVGAEYAHYAADISRTVSRQEPTPRQQAVYDGVLRVHEYALSLLKPGTTLRQYEREVETFMGEQLRALGLIGSISTEAVRRFYPHATSHYLGLTAHDAGLYDEPLTPNVVLVVEPGIYIPEESIGIRIEDEVVITATGNRLLSDALPRTLVL